MATIFHFCSPGFSPASASHSLHLPMRVRLPAACRSQSRPQMQNPTRAGGGGGSSPLHHLIPGCRRKQTSSRLWKGKQRSCERQWSNRRQKTTYVSELGVDLLLGSLRGAAPGSSSPVELWGSRLVCQRAGGPLAGCTPHTLKLVGCMGGVSLPCPPGRLRTL